jgi:hypothetical protein
LSWDIVDAMSTVKELVPSPDGIVFEPLLAALDDDEDEDDDEDDDDVADDEQPAATTAMPVARATQPSRGRGLNVPWPGEREGHSPCLLLPSSMPYSFRRNALGSADAGDRATRVSLRDER